jgi:hypothetical protein
MLADFEAVEPFKKIAIRVLTRRGSMCISSWMKARPELIRLDTIVAVKASQGRLNQAQKLSVLGIGCNAATRDRDTSTNTTSSMTFENNVIRPKC